MVARSVPYGIFLIVEPRETGKTTVVIILLMAAFERGKKPVFCSLPNAAVTKICKCAQMKNAVARYLCVGCHPEHEKHAIIFDVFVRSKKEEKPDDRFVTGAVVAEEAAEETSEKPSVAPEKVSGHRKSN